MRNRFDEQLDLLNIEMIKMGALCEKAISASVKLISDSGENMQSIKEAVFETDSEIDHKEREIENLCMKLLLCQQPVARDLRVISSALKMISDMERIGDQASDIAELSDYVKKEDAKYVLHINDMAAAVINMVTVSIDSFVKKDLELVRQVIAADDTVDEYFNTIKHSLIELISSGSTEGEAYIDLLMIAKYLERIGDHATNIAEWVAYSITGEHKTLV